MKERLSAFGIMAKLYYNRGVQSRGLWEFPW